LLSLQGVLTAPSVQVPLTHFAAARQAPAAWQTVISFGAGSCTQAPKGPQLSVVHALLSLHAPATCACTGHALLEPVHCAACQQPVAAAHCVPAPPGVCWHVLLTQPSVVHGLLS
jgi:hypothetical protein